MSSLHIFYIIARLLSRHLLAHHALLLRRRLRLYTINEGYLTVVGNPNLFTAHEKGRTRGLGREDRRLTFQTNKKRGDFAIDICVQSGFITKIFNN